ncbi:hypothetical protein O3M35_005997 [Rhynocoris fuscipes]|uniref:Protein kinase domain-containing protein n=1 Tax=Rhynocoris fuscipes TaxID=488301 RepID=A0AAW1DDD6_9HEMI
MQAEETRKYVSQTQLFESSFRRDQDEEHSNKTGTRTKRFRCPIYMPRSEENLLKSKGVELVELLGEGSYSKVYLCKKKDQQQEMRGGAPVSYVLALKIVDSNKTSAEYTKKFLPRELSVLMKIRHPNIIRLYMLLQRKSKFYILMRYAERGDLLEYILGNGLITENRARFWTYQIATAIEYLHTMNVVHRDIKTENILITECFNVKLTDFGFSRFIGHEELSSTYCGSISYSPPEILELKPHDAKKSDMWSFGVVIFVMLIKRLPFRESENPKDLLAEQLQKSYIMPPKMEEVLSLPSKKALKHLLQPNPAKRWDIKELLGSQWIAMDFRLTKKSDAEKEALEQAKNLAKEIEQQTLDVTNLQPITARKVDSKTNRLSGNVGKTVRFAETLDVKNIDDVGGDGQWSERRRSENDSSNVWRSSATRQTKSDGSKSVRHLLATRKRTMNRTDGNSAKKMYETLTRHSTSMTR